MTDLPKLPEHCAYNDRKSHVIIRRCRIEDASCLVEAINGSQRQLNAFMDWSHDPHTRQVEHQVHRLHHLHSLWHQGKTFTYHCFIVHKNNPLQFIGTVSLEACGHPHALELGGWVRSDRLIRQYTTRVFQMATLATLYVGQRTRIQTKCDVANRSAQYVLKALGYQYEGTLRNVGYPATDEMRANGWRGTQDETLHSLIPDDLETLSWVKEVAQHLKIST